MPEPRDGLAVWRGLGAVTYDRERLETFGQAALDYLRGQRGDPADVRRSWETMVGVLDELPGETLQDRWDSFQRDIWPSWMCNKTRPPDRLWSNGVRRIQIGRIVRSDLELPGIGVPLIFVVSWLPAADAFRLEIDRLRAASEAVRWVEDERRAGGVALGLRVMLRCGYNRLEEITEQDLRELPGRRRGADVLDGALCHLGIFGRTPVRGATRGGARRRRSPSELAHAGEMPDHFGR